MGQGAVDSANLRHLGKDWDSLIRIDLARQERSIFTFKEQRHVVLEHIWQHGSVRQG